MPLDLELLSEADLAIRAQAGDTDCFEMLMRRCEQSIFAFLLQRTSNWHDAEELTQETFVRAYQQLGRYDPRLPFLAWLYTIARRLSISLYRAASTRQRAVAQAAITTEVLTTGEPGDDCSAKEDALQLWALARQHLPERQFTALWLRYEMDLGVREIARTMGLLAPHVKELLFRAKRTLGQHLPKTPAKALNSPPKPTTPPQAKQSQP